MAEQKPGAYDSHSDTELLVEARHDPEAFVVFYVRNFRSIIITPTTPESGWEAIEAIDAEIDKDRLAAALSRVPAKSREAVRLRIIEQIDYGEIARKMGCTHGSARSLVFLEIIDLVTDPRSAERQLRDELGVSVDFLARPAPPELVGQVLAVEGTGTSTARVVFDGAGRSERIVLPHEIDGALAVHYGRNARDGERYDVTVTSFLCTELWAMSPQQAHEHLVGLADRIRYDTIDASYNYTSSVPLAEVDPGYRLIDVMYLSSEELLVVHSSHLDALGAERSNCGWSAASPH